MARNNVFVSFGANPGSKVARDAGSTNPSPQIPAICHIHKPLVSEIHPKVFAWFKIKYHHYRKQWPENISQIFYFFSWKSNFFLYVYVYTIERCLDRHDEISCLTTFYDKIIYLMAEKRIQSGTSLVCLDNGKDHVWLDFCEENHYSNILVMTYVYIVLLKNDFICKMRWSFQLQFPVCSTRGRFRVVLWQNVRLHCSKEIKMRGWQLNESWLFRFQSNAWASLIESFKIDYLSQRKLIWFNLITYNT